MLGQVSMWLLSFVASHRTVVLQRKAGAFFRNKAYPFSMTMLPGPGSTGSLCKCWSVLFGAVLKREWSSIAKVGLISPKSGWHDAAG